MNHKEIETGTKVRRKDFPGVYTVLRLAITEGHVWLAKGPYQVLVKISDLSPPSKDDELDDCYDAYDEDEDDYYLNLHRTYTPKQRLIPYTEPVPTNPPFTSNFREFELLKIEEDIKLKNR